MAEKSKKDKLIEKIKNLLALADTSANPNENEAQLALLKAQELMLKYNIELPEEERTDKPIIVKYYFKNRRQLSHHRIIAGLVADNFRSKTFFSKSYCYFLGYAVDAEAALCCYEFLVDYLEGAFKVFLRNDKRANPWKYINEGASFSKYIKRSWINGFMVGLNIAFEKRRDESNQYALVLVTPEQVEKAFNEMDLKEVNLNVPNEMDTSAYGEGVDIGKNSLSQRELPNKRGEAF